MPELDIKSAIKARKLNGCTNLDFLAHTSKLYSYSAPEKENIKIYHSLVGNGRDLYVWIVQLILVIVMFLSF